MLFVACDVLSSVGGKYIRRPSHGGAAGLRAPTAIMVVVTQLAGKPTNGHAAPVLQLGK